MLDKNWYWYIIDETIINTFLIRLMRKIIILFISFYNSIFFLLGEQTVCYFVPSCSRKAHHQDWVSVYYCWCTCMLVDESIGMNPYHRVDIKFELCVIDALFFHKIHHADFIILDTKAFPISRSVACWMNQTCPYGRGIFISYSLSACII